MSFKAMACENAAKTLIPKFEKRGMAAYYCAPKEEAGKKLYNKLREWKYFSAEWKIKTSKSRIGSYKTT